MSTESDNTFEKNANEQIELLDKQRTQVMREANADYLANVASMHKSLSDFTADTQVEAAALSGISDLPFDKLIGGPLSAVIAAQSEAANATLKFIQAAGIRKDKVVVVSFDYVKDGVLRKFQIPLLTLVPIPSFAIKSLDYEFKVKVKAESSANASISSSLSNTWNAGYNSVEEESKPNTGSNDTETVNPSNKTEDQNKTESQKKAEEQNKTEGQEVKASSDEKKADVTTDTGVTSAEQGKSTEGEKAKNKNEATACPAANAIVEAASTAKNEKEKGEAKKKAAAATSSAKVSEAAAKAKPAGYSMSASISTKKDSTATRESKYSVEATMDVRINAGQEDLPSGLLTMLEVLNSSFSIYDPDGEITIVPQTGVVNIGSNGKATILAKYLNEDGVYAPSELKCNDSNATVDILDKTQVRLTFNKPGVYVITAGTQSATVTVNPVEGTKQLIQDEP